MNIQHSIGITLAICGIGVITAQAQTSGPTEQVLQMRTLGQALVWTGRQAPSESESRDLLDVLSQAGEEGWSTNVEQFFSNHPQSPWAASLHHDYALYCRQIGRTSRALEEWQAAWDLVKDDTSPAARKLAGSIIANWMDLLSSLGRLDQLKELIAVGNQLQFANPHDRDLFQGARNAYYLMAMHPGIAYRCGTFALKAVGEKLGIGQNLEALVGLRSPTNGFSMEQLVEIGRQHGLNVVAVHRTKGQELIVPSVVHWRVNHYAAILEKQGDRYLVSDPTFGNERYLTADVINEEASGDFLIPAAMLTNGWTSIETNQIASIRGMGLPNNINDALDKGCLPGGQCPPCAGMPVWWISEPYINLWMADEPISYLTSRGEPMTLRLSYKQRDSRTQTDGPVVTTGWNNSWFSYIALSELGDYSNGSMPVSLASCTVQLYLADGGEVDFAQGQTYDPETRSLLQQIPLNDSLSAAPDNGKNGIRVVHADGSQDIYGWGLHDFVGGHSYLRAYFLRTRHIDEHGDTTWFNYTYTNGGSAYLLNSVVDYDGGTNWLYYTEISGVPYFSAMTNAYGQSIHLKYDGNGNLTNLVDAIGMTSGIAYDTNSLPTSLTTPYGTTAFSLEDNGISYYGGTLGNAGGDANQLIDRSALVIDPTDATNLYMYRYDSALVWSSSTFANAPTNTPLGTLDIGNADTNTDNGLNAVYFRDSYHWNPHQYAALSTANMTNFTAGDYLLARTRHWLQDSNDQYVTGYLSVERDPSPDGTTEGLKTFYDYQGKTLTYREGTNPLPSVIAWCLPGGESHYEHKIYDYFGNVTNDITTYTKTDGSLGTRTNQFIYADNACTNISIGVQGTTFYYLRTNVFIASDLLTKVIGADGNPVWSAGSFDGVAITNFIYSATQTNGVIIQWSRVLPDFMTNGLGQTASATYGSFDRIA
ncbi:MAG TPA: cysteine peptidase family C39 domain-containing protein, partial [Verrucomicrobiae bacterium]